MASTCLIRPAAAEVKAMLQKIKLDNMERGRKLAVAMAQPAPVVFRGTSLSPQSYNLDNQMGSFTSMPKIRPSPNSEDTDVVYVTDQCVNLDQFLANCRRELGSLPPAIPRSFRHRRNSLSHEGFTVDAAFSFLRSEPIRVFQWNVLSQALGTGNDNFVKCPSEALEWKTRRFRMLEEIARHNADVICLQEVDHFSFLRKSLASLGYTGHFTPKPDSPCLYLPNNSGPDRKSTRLTPVTSRSRMPSSAWKKKKQKLKKKKKNTTHTTAMH